MFDRSFVDILDRAFDTHASRVLIQYRGERLTYREADALSARIANFLTMNGFQPGSKAAVYSTNSSIALLATIGLIRAGGTWIPINPRNSERDNIATLIEFGCDPILYQERFADAVLSAKRSRDKPPLTVCLDDLESLLQDVTGDRPQPNTCGSDLLSIPLTGGTTGVPKGVMLSHRNFCALDFAQRDRYAGRLPTVLCATPMTHAAGRVALTSMSSGARLIVTDRVDPLELLGLMEEERITDVQLPPTVIHDLLRHSDVRNFDYSSLQSFVYGSAPIALGLLKEAIDVFGPVMHNVYGQTECPYFISSFDPADHFVDGKVANGLVPDDRLRSVGRSTIISEIAIVDGNVSPLSPNVRGEIAVKGPMVSEGYFNDPEETAKVRKNGWHLTGDIGYLDEDGFLYIVDRKKDMIISGGFNVYSTEVEQALMSLETVKCAVVIGVPSERWGEEVKAVVQVADGSSVSADTLISATKQLIGSVKAPKSIDFVSEFPRTAVGKVDKKAIRARYQRPAT